MVVNSHVNSAKHMPFVDVRLRQAPISNFCAPPTSSVQLTSLASTSNTPLQTQWSGNIPCGSMPTLQAEVMESKNYIEQHSYASNEEIGDAF